MLSAGVEVLLYNGGLLHTKSISVDDEYAVFGTVNFDNRSIHLNFEMMLLIFDACFIHDLKSCTTPMRSSAAVSTPKPGTGAPCPSASRKGPAI